MLWRRRSRPTLRAGTPELGGYPPEAGRHPQRGPLYFFNSLLPCRLSQTIQRFRCPTIVEGFNGRFDTLPERV